MDSNGKTGSDIKATMTMTMRNILFDLRCNNHNIYRSFRK